MATGTSSPDDGGPGGPDDGGPSSGDSDDDDPTDPDDADSDTDDDATDDDATDTGPGPACDGEGVDPTCPGTAPFCADGTCVDCSDLMPTACGGLDGATPVCDEGTCVGCWEHDQCGSGACRMATGECFPMANRLWVDSAAGGCAAATGSEASPFCEIITAITVVNDQAGTEPWAIFVAGNPAPYNGTLSPRQRPVAIIGPAAGLGAEATADSYALDVWSQAPETYIANMTLSSNSTSSTIRGANNGDCLLWLHDTTVEGGSPGITTGSCDITMHRSDSNGYDTFGIEVTPTGTLTTYDTWIHGGQGGMVIDGTAHLERSTVSNNFTMGGITLTGDLTMVNSLMYANEYTNDGIRASDGGQFDLLYTTVVGAIDCTDNGPSTIRNSIVMGHNFEAGQACTSAAVDYSVVNLGVGQGAGNVMADDTDLDSIFVDPVTNGADYHVIAGSIPMDVAVWNEGDPAGDQDGDARPSADATADYAGHDVP
ncbi:MAG: hypothetical protein AAF721_04990 [Myxococcota bacterium]